MIRIRVASTLIILCVVNVPGHASAQGVDSNVATVIVVEQRPRPDAVAIVRIEVDEHGHMANTITLARNDVSRASVYSAVLLLNAFRDANEMVRGSVEIELKPDMVPNEHTLSVEARKYVEYYLLRLSRGDGSPRVVIPLRARNGAGG